MGESEQFIVNLRSYVGRLQRLIQALEESSSIEFIDSQTQLQEVIRGLKELEHVSSTRLARRGLRAEWLN